MRVSKNCQSWAPSQRRRCWCVIPAGDSHLPFPPRISLPPSSAAFIAVPRTCLIVHFPFSRAACIKEKSFTLSPMMGTILCMHSRLCDVTNNWQLYCFEKLIQDVPRKGIFIVKNPIFDFIDQDHSIARHRAGKQDHDDFINARRKELKPSNGARFHRCVETCRHARCGLQDFKIFHKMGNWF